MLKLITDGKHLAKDSFSANDVDACSNVWHTLYEDKYNVYLYTVLG